MITKDPYTLVVNNINLLLQLAIPVSVSIYIDKANKHMLRDFLNLAYDNHWVDTPLIDLEIGRVEDRCYSGTSDDIMSEAELLKYLYDYNREEPFPKNIKFAFLKTSLAMAQRFGFDFNQNERGRLRFHYCWAGTPYDNIQYIDNKLNVYRCTYSVGRSDLALSNLNDNTFFEKNNFFSRSSFIDMCWNCPIGGYCGGGCSISSHFNQTRLCKEEYENFNFLIHNMILPIIREKMKNV